jgi:hypothetical protein
MRFGTMQLKRDELLEIVRFRRQKETGENKREQHLELKKQMAAFLSGGGEVTQVEAGVQGGQATYGREYTNVQSGLQRGRDVLKKKRAAEKKRVAEATRETL